MLAIFGLTILARLEFRCEAAWLCLGGFLAALTAAGSASINAVHGESGACGSCYVAAEAGS